MLYCRSCPRTVEAGPSSNGVQTRVSDVGNSNPRGMTAMTVRELGRELKEKHKVRDAVTLTSCSICHR